MVNVDTLHNLDNKHLAAHIIEQHFCLSGQCSLPQWVERGRSTPAPGRSPRAAAIGSWESSTDPSMELGRYHLHVATSLNVVLFAFAVSTRTTRTPQHMSRGLEKAWASVVLRVECCIHQHAPSEKGDVLPSLTWDRYFRE